MASPLEQVSHDIRMPPPREETMHPLQREPRTFSPSGTVRLCRAILHFKTALDNDAAAGSEKVSLPTAVELYFSSHFPGAVCYKRMTGFFASLVGYQVR